MEQVGTPFEIYNFPKTDFVAHFVGTLNAIKVEVRDAAAGLLAVSEQQIRTAQKLGTVRSGETTTISLRPERLSFAADGKKVNLLDCTVEKSPSSARLFASRSRRRTNSLYGHVQQSVLELPRLVTRLKSRFRRKRCWC